MIDKLAWLHVKDKRVLAARSHGKTLFYLPGGKREVGESDQAALMREIEEELSVRLIADSIKYLETFSAQADGKAAGMMVQMTCYSADYDGELKVASEIAEMRWLKADDKAFCSKVDHLILDWLLARGLIE